MRSTQAGWLISYFIALLVLFAARVFFHPTAHLPPLTTPSSARDISSNNLFEA
jgi:hypothetical protein